MKIIGNTVGTTLPRSNLDQTDPTRDDYIFGDRTALQGEKGDPGERGPAGADGATVQQVLEALPRVTAIDFSDFEKGRFTETVNGETLSHTVTFDGAGLPVSIDDIAVIWGS